MRLESRNLLEDVRQAIGLILQFAESEKLERQRTTRTLEAKRDDAWLDYDQASRDINRQKDALLDDIGDRLEQTVEQSPLFTLRWRLG